MAGIPADRRLTLVLEVPEVSITPWFFSGPPGPPGHFVASYPVVRLAIQIAIPNRRTDTDSPSKIRCHPSGFRGVTTSFPHPQQQRCMAVTKGIETYRTPSARSSGMK